MGKTDYKQTVVVFTDKEFDEKKKSYLKKKVALNYYDFESVELKMYAKPEVKDSSVRIGYISIPGLDNCTIWENDGDYGTYRSGTVDKGQLYFNVKKGLARRGESAPITVTFREAVLDSKTDDLADIESEDSDTPF